MCGYKVDNSDHMGLEWHREESGDDRAPDHTLGHSLGHYMVAKSEKPHTKGRMARLLTHQYTQNTVCARFWYKIIGDVEFNVRLFTNAYQPNAHFSANTQRGVQWLLGQASITNLESYQVRFSFKILLSLIKISIGREKNP